jgi:hypothetical protein
MWGLLKGFFGFWAGLFARRDDDFKALLISDLGIER